MQNDPGHLIQIVFFAIFVAVLLLGGYVIANFNRFFGPDPNIPSETNSGRTYTKVQIILVWLHAVGISGALAFLLHLDRPRFHLSPFASMNRIYQVDPAQASGKTKDLFDTVQARLGKIPNLMRVFANSPAAFEGYLQLSGALARGVLPLKLRESIALAVGEINGCGYCLSAHTLSRGKAGLSQEEILAARRSTSVEDKFDAALKLARAIALQRGHVANDDLQNARAAGLNDAEIVEIIQHVALNTLTNYTNNVAKTVLDFPEVKPGELEPQPAAA